MRAIAEPIVFDDARARWNAIVLALGQALYSSSTVIMFTTAGLVGVQIAPSKGWATLPISAFVIGTALSTIPASLLMKRIGRKPGFMLGAFAGMLGGLLAVVAIYQRNFALFVASTMLQGLFQAFSLHSRFAAADMSSPAFRPKAIAWVMTGGVAAAIFGTLLVMGTTDLLAPITFAGCYATMAILSACAIAVLAFLDIPHGRVAVTAGSGRPFSKILVQPRFVVAVAAATVSYGMMNLVMTASPIAMFDCGFSYDDASWVIQWHVLGMFVPSFFTAHIISRFGAERVCATGLALLAMAAAIAVAGIHFENFAISLILLGLGWNFGFIGGTTLLTRCYQPAEAAKVQAFNDFTVFATVACASLLSGQILAVLGWVSVNMAVFPFVLPALLFMGWLALRSRKETVRG